MHLFIRQASEKAAVQLAQAVRQREAVNSYATAVTADQPFEATVEAARAALAERGFGVLTEIDVQATLKAKLGVDTEPCLILGACNPAMAHAGLQAEPSLAVLLPCNVVIRSNGAGSTVVEAINPATLVTLTGNDRLEPVAAEIAARLTEVLNAVISPNPATAPDGEHP